MEVNHLTDDELKIELEVRKLIDAGEGVTETIKLRLEDLLDEEKEDQSKVPVKPHEAARRNPRREIDVLARKMETILQKILLQDAAGDPSKAPIKDNFNAMMTQLIHIIGRLGRISTSNVIRKQLPGMYKAQQKLSKLVGEVLSGNLALIAAIVAAAEITIPAEVGKDDKEAEVVKPQQEDDDPSMGTNKNKPGTSKSVVEATGEVDEESNDRNAFRNTLIHLKQELEDRIVQFDEAETKPAGRVQYDLEVAEETGSEVGELSLPLDAKICRDPSTWGLKFEGTRSNMHVERFFYRVERMALKSKISLNGLVDYMSLLLSGEALEWFWTFVERHNHVSWEMLKREMIQRFQASRSDDDVRRMLGQRKQMYPKESFLDFHDAVLKIALQAKKPITDQEIYNYLRRNMRPGLQLELYEKKNFPSVSHFVRKCVAIEDLWRRFGVNPESKLSTQHHGYNNYNNHNNYSGGNRFQPRVHEIEEKEPVYYDDNKEQSEDEYDEYDGQVCAINNNYHSNRNRNYQSNGRPLQIQRSKPMTFATNKPEAGRAEREYKPSACWNCSEPGHTFFDCRNPVRHVFCYGCGARGIYKPDCIKCNSSENFKPELRNNRESQLVNGARPKTMILNRKQTEEAAANTDPELFQKH